MNNLKLVTYRDGGMLRVKVVDAITGELLDGVVDANVHCGVHGCDVVLTLKDVELDIEFEVRSIDLFGSGNPRDTNEA